MHFIKQKYEKQKGVKNRKSHRQFYKDVACALKAKLWWVRARKRKKWAFFEPFILSEGNFFNFWVLSQFIVSSLSFQNMHTLYISKTLLHTLFCFFLKSSKPFSVSWECEISNYQSNCQFWCSGYYYCTTPFNKAWTRILRMFKYCLPHVRNLW